MDCYSCKNNTRKIQLSPSNILFEGQYWNVDHAYPTALLGWFVIVFKRHAEGIHELTRNEFGELTGLVQKISSFLHEELKTKKEYVACFSEAEHFNHIHFHIIPRGEQVTEDIRGPKVFSLLRVEEKDSVSKNEVIKLSNKLKKKLRTSTL